MSKKPASSPQSRALKAAIDKLPGRAKNVLLAQHLGVDPSFVSQCANNYRPLPSQYAVAAGQFLSVPPGSISLAYAEEVSRHGAEAKTPAELPDVIDNMQRDLDALQALALVMLASMKKHRPVEAVDAGDTVQRLAAAKPHLLNHPLVRELLSETAVPRKSRGAKSV